MECVLLMLHSMPQLLDAEGDSDPDGAGGAGGAGAGGAGGAGDGE